MMRDDLVVERSSRILHLPRNPICLTVVRYPSRKFVERYGYIVMLSGRSPKNVTGFDPECTDESAIWPKYDMIEMLRLFEAVGV